MQELNFSLNFINQNSVGFLNRILGNNQNILIEGENSIPRDVVLGDLPYDQHENFSPESDRPTPANSISGSGARSLDSSSNSSGRD